ncbi:quinone oxidoreductase [Alkalilimnicola ehrlichii]|uniref:NADPH:quinone reductase n=1 Tax=Alkalilimnicola ehrlichii TaxID=351052 RepID=A0A3E0WR00_9GAMM|nr:quinone oxidoreductase [Alkalilimnicola ehrlichii]RFA27217.1 quinone oxidoreductase [Alkalilimnicola ehrlichii]RFA35390.1 quinone oxidoreductase [Alkalilimnicola ehrlichii]
MQAILVHEHGDSNVLRWENVPDPTAPGPHEVLVRHRAVGLNFIDIYFRTGLYPPPSLPFTPGVEAVGVVEAIGEHVQDLQPGDRVGYVYPTPGAYCERRTLPAERLVRIPDDIDDQTAAAMLLKGMTAQILLRRTFPVAPGHTVLVHAAAGGVGSLLCQAAKHLGATVIGTVGSAAKAEQARANGCDHPIDYRQDDFVEATRALTHGRGVDVVYDSVGQATFERSLDCLKPLGTMVSFGQSSGAIAPFNIGLLAGKGSLYLTRPSLFTYIAERQALEASAAELIDWVRQGVLTIPVNQTYPLASAAQAQDALEQRLTTGATVLLCE